MNSPAPPPGLPGPPDPFDATTEILPIDTVLVRVHSNWRDPAEPNPGFGPPSRFAFFPRDPGEPGSRRSVPVPVMYAAESARATIAETVLHDAVRRPGRFNAIGPAGYLGLTLSRLRATRELRCADLTGLHAKRLGIDGAALSAHHDYVETVRWAEAAYRAGFDGLAYMSHRCNTDRAYVFFDRRPESLGAGAPTPLRASFTTVSADPIDPALLPSRGFDALVDACTAAGFEVLV